MITVGNGPADTRDFCPYLTFKGFKSYEKRDPVITPELGDKT